MRRNGDPAADRVTVVGAGFAAAAAVEFITAAGVDVEVVDPNGYLLFTPLLHRVALGSLEPEEVVFPVSAMGRGRGRLTCRRAKVVSVDIPRRVLRCADQIVPFSRLVLATGGRPRRIARGARPLALAGLGATLELRDRLAAATTSGAPVIIVGAGPIGVELAGPLAQRGADVTVISAGAAPLADMSPVARRFAAVDLRRVGVRLELGVRVVQAGPEWVIGDDGQRFEAPVVVWATGVEGTLPAGVTRLADRRIRCGHDLSVLPGVVYAAGDVAAPGARSLPMLASVAVQQGRLAARNLLAAAGGRPTHPFRYLDHGRLVYVTEGNAVAEIGGLAVPGPAAWALADTWHRLLRRYPTLSAGPWPAVSTPTGPISRRTPARSG